MEQMKTIDHETTGEVQVKTAMVSVLAYRGDTLVDITMVEAYDDGAGWHTTPGTIFEDLPSLVTRLVVELPSGCVETYTWADKGQELRFVGPETVGSIWTRCQR